MEMILLRIAQDFREVTLKLAVGEFAKLDGHEVAVHAQHWRHADGEMDVGATLGEAQL
jgi:hypothetical protein